MNRIQSTERPAPFTANPGQPTRNVNFDIQEEAEGYSYYSVTVPIARWDYDNIVSYIITAEYPNDRMQAVINNYHQETDLATLIDLLRTTQNFNKLRSAMAEWLSSRDKDIVAEYETMQQWRAMAKEVAKEILDL